MGSRLPFLCVRHSHLDSAVEDVCCCEFQVDTSKALNGGTDTLAAPPIPPIWVCVCAAGHCYYRIEEWWTYELCFKQKLRQYHKDDGRTVSQYLMGSYAAGGEQEDEVQVRG